jgi:sugar transferase (PEP-CTERM/EpsH1 system associated)
MNRSSSPPLVVHIIYALGTGGLENGLVNIINRMPPERYKHVIICLTHATDFAKRITAPDVKVIELHKRAGHDLGVYWRLQKLLWQLKPDLVHTRNLAALEMQALTLLLPSVKRVHGEHGRDIYDLHGQNKKYNRLRKVMSYVVHRYIAVSQDLENWLLTTVDIPREKVKQLYNGVDLSRFNQLDESGITDVLPPEFAKDCFIIGTVGRVAAVKDQLTLLKAFDILVKGGSELSDKLRLVIVGDGPLFADLERQVYDLGLDEKVWLAGDRKDIPALLRSMDVFALPSLGEGISNTVLEAMATGLPVVATRVGGNPELVDDQNTGALVPVGNSEELARVLLDIANDKDKLSAMGAAGLLKVEKQFHWDITVAKYLAVYDELLK